MSPAARVQHAQADLGRGGAKSFRKEPALPFACKQPVLSYSTCTAAARTFKLDSAVGPPEKKADLGHSVGEAFSPMYPRPWRVLHAYGLRAT